MIWIIAGLCLLAIVSWLLISPLIITIDTRTPIAILNWKTIASAHVWFQDNWYVRIHIFFYHKTICLSTQASAKRKVTSFTRKKHQKRKRPLSLKKIRNIVHAFRVHQWRLSIDTGDYALNGQLFALNYLPQFYWHVDINFRNENFLELHASCRPWRLLRAFMK